MQSNVVVNVTAKKIGIKSKKKEYIRSEKLTVNGTVSAASTASSGLTTSTYLGTRVQDDVNIIKFTRCCKGYCCL